MSATRKMTVDEYLAMERKSEERHVYLDGDVFGMAGESFPDGDISGNLVGEASMTVLETPLKPLVTVDDYLAKERHSLERNVFLDGVVFAMAGESLPHGIISTNLIAWLVPYLDKFPCQVLSKDFKVRSGPVPLQGKKSKGMFSYPDVLILCDPPEFHDSHKDIVLNPTVILEILSPSTEAFDRGEKFARYQKWNPSLKDYLLVSQDKPMVELFSRGEDGKWSLQWFEGLESKALIPSIQAAIPLEVIFRRVEFPVSEDNQE